MSRIPPHPRIPRIPSAEPAFQFDYEVRCAQWRRIRPCSGFREGLLRAARR